MHQGDLENKKTSSKEENDLWNEIHISLVRDLETKGILWRYGVKHLKLWTDMIINGKCSGVGEEPVWEDHLEQVIIPPKSRKSNVSSSTSTTSSDDGQTTRGLMEMLMLQNQQRMDAESRRAEMMHTTLLTMMSSNFALLQNQVKN